MLVLHPGYNLKIVGGVNASGHLFVEYKLVLVCILIYSNDHHGLSFGRRPGDDTIILMMGVPH